MARPCKLTPKQVAEIKRRRLDGESVRGLAREYKVAASMISRIVSERTEIMKTVANQLAVAESNFENLPVSEQVPVRNLADQLKGISCNLAAAARSGSITAARLSNIAEKQSLQINEFGTVEENALPLKAVMMTSQVANEAAKIPLNLLAANKKIIEDINDDVAGRAPVPEGLGFLYGE